ncbi:MULTISPECIES: lytic transglycosylase domain-containing protein [Pseudovibrio]|uniref:lytic transglycosylase domain-containing protein n=1 Tax=Stappiaceae TaxID=2821832 RepID=UPI002365E2E1|nr:MULTISPECIES: lytic transglycosylase domain-containing protein [Pseudovibrio]MDD7910552.1 lytic transglycosylase domain-containing protein [Pseudovibrio exalbescens]MDX5594599.1 lytic transglycosylase domain-containing protein [Pseudovibrio sp. SPO723]
MKVAGDASISARIERAFESASHATGTPFGYLVQAAAKESSMDPQAKAQTSSATGLFQFIESTWLETLKKSGDELGLEDYARHIEVTSDGDYVVENPHLREQLLDLRKDPEVSALVAGAFTQANREVLTSKLNRTPSTGELYVAHFLGASGGARLISAAEQTPEVDASALFPQQARANKAIFYERNGEARSVAQVYDRLVNQFAQTEMTIAAKQVMQVDETAVGGLPPVPKEKADQQAEPDVIQSRILTAWATSGRHPGAPFEALFRATDETKQAEAVSASISSAFAAQEDNAADLGAAGVPRPRPAGTPLDLTGFLNYGAIKPNKA